MPRKPRTPAPVTALDEQQAVEAAHAAELTANPVVDPTGEPLPDDEDAARAQYQTGAGVADEIHQPPAETHHPAHEPHQGDERTGPKPVDWSVVEEYANRHGHRPGGDKQVVNGVHLNRLDYGNHGGTGIQVDVEKAEDKPRPDETEVLKSGGFRYRGGEWRAEIDRRDPGASRDAHKATFSKFVDKFRSREGGEPER